MASDRETVLAHKLPVSSDEPLSHLTQCALVILCSILTILCIAAQNFMAARSQSALSARLGESTTAYSSPSKDINTINGHLTGKKYPFQLASSAPGSNIVLQGLDSSAVRLRLCYHHVVPAPVLDVLLSEKETA